MSKIEIAVFPILIIALLLMGYFGYKCHIYTKSYESGLKRIASMSDINALTQQKIDNLKSAITFGLIKNRSKEKFKLLQKINRKNKQLAKNEFYYFLTTLCVIIFVSFLISLKFETIILGIATIISLIFGLINPVLMVTVHKEVEYFGDVILSFESKGILDSVIKLFSNGEVIIAIAILIFSVILPLIKSLILVPILLFPSSKISHIFLNFFKNIGKWSMLDVFIVSIFLVFLASNNGKITDAKIEYGLYFFLIYVFLSTITTMKIQKFLSMDNI